MRMERERAKRVERENQLKKEREEQELLILQKQEENERIKECSEKIEILKEKSTPFKKAIPKMLLNI